jgi:2-polyprenyl-6-methoxyphenol hydroxylase-like FAD-dependent oxidoreductase
MCAAGGPADAVNAGDVGPSLRRLLARITDHDGAIGAAYRWPMRDVRSDRWVADRVALSGDAAVGSIPLASW